MTVENASPDFPEYDGKTAKVWDRNAEWWDDQIGDGNAVQDLLEPITESMLELKPGNRVLDIAYGAGRFARRMATGGADVVAIDHSERFIQRARQRSKENDHKIDYRVMNATDQTALLSLGQASFDAAVCTMALMDMASIDPLISTLPQLLKPGSPFVFSVTHPVFNSGTARRIAEEQDRDGALITTFGAVVTDYSRRYVHMGIGIPAQPEPQYFFHRPIHMLLNACFKHGFVLAGIPQIKPTFLDIAPSGIPSSIIPHSKGVKCGLIRSNSPFSYSNHRPAKPKIPKPLVYAQVSPLGTSFATP